MREHLRLALALFRTSWIRSLTTVVGIAAVTAMATSVLLVLNAFDRGVKEQLDGVFQSHNLMVATRTGGPMTADQLGALVHTEGVEKVLPFSQFNASLAGERTLLLILPDPAEARPESRQVWVSTPLRTKIGQPVGAHVELSVGTSRLSTILGPDPSSQGHPELDKSAYAVMTASAVQALGLPELAAPNVVMINAPGAQSQDQLSKYVAKEPGLTAQDRAAADATLRTGIQPILQNLPLVALISFLLGLVLVFTIIRAGADTERTSLVLLRALGASSRSLRRLAMASALVHGIVGCAIGLALARPAATSLMNSVPTSTRNSAAPVPSIPIPPLILSVVALVVLGACLAAALSGAKPILQLSAEDQFRGDIGERPKSRSFTYAAFGTAALGAGVYATLSDPKRYSSLGLLLVLLGWSLAGEGLVGVLLRWFDNFSVRSRPGFVSRSSDRRVARQMRSGALVVSGALALLVALSGLASNLQASTEPTLAGLGDIDIMVQDVALDDLPTMRNLPSSAEAALSSLPGVSAVHPIQMGYVSYGTSRILVQGAQEQSQLPVVQQGRSRGGNLSQGSAYVSTQLASLSGLKVGDDISLSTPSGNTSTMHIVAVVDSFLWPGGLLVMNIADTQLLWPGDGNSAYEVMTHGSWEDVRADILSRRTQLHLAASTFAVSGPDQAAQAQKVVKDSSQLYASLASIGLLVAMLIASSAIALDTSSRLREFGVMRALGGRSRFLAAMVVVRSVLLVAPATIVGALFGYVLLYLITDSSAKAQGINLGMHWSWSSLALNALACLSVIVVAAAGSSRLVTSKPAPEMLGADE